MRNVVFDLQQQQTSPMAALQRSVFKDNQALLTQLHPLFAHTLLDVTPPGSDVTADPLAEVSSLCPSLSAIDAL